VRLLPNNGLCFKSSSMMSPVRAISQHRMQLAGRGLWSSSVVGRRLSAPCAARCSFASGRRTVKVQFTASVR
jgi:hypothetical protein